MKLIQGDFPFNELKKHTGDYYDNRMEMEHAGFEEKQMWSVTHGEGDDGSESYCYGPVHHYVNLIGYIATAEYHDGNTYYEECIKTAKEAAAEAAYFCEKCED